MGADGRSTSVAPTLTTVGSGSADTANPGDQGPYRGSSPHGTTWTLTVRDGSSAKCLMFDYTDGRGGGGVGGCYAPPLDGGSVLLATERAYFGVVTAQAQRVVVLLEAGSRVDASLHGGSPVKYYVAFTGAQDVPDDIVATDGNGREIARKTQ